MRSPWVQICSTMVHRSPCDTRSSSTEWEVRDMASEQSARVRDASLSESTVEDVALDWLASLGWAVAHGPDIAPDTPSAERADYGTVVLTNRLRSALARLNPELPDEALEDALRRLTRPAGATLPLPPPTAGRSTSPTTTRLPNYWRSTWQIQTQLAPGMLFAVIDHRCATYAPGRPGIGGATSERTWW